MELANDTGSSANTLSATSASNIVAGHKPPSKRVAEVLLIGLTSDKNISPDVQRDLDDLEELFRTQVAPEQLDLNVITGPDCIADTIISKIRSMKDRLSPDDSLIVYYSGHGAYDPKLASGDPSGGQFLRLPGGDLRRKELFDTMLAQPGRLKVLVSDMCSARSTFRLPQRLVPETRVMTVIGPTRFEQLFLYHSGYLDLSATSRDQLSWGGAPYGGWFTHTFVNTAAQFSNWPDCFNRLSTDANNLYLKNRDLITAMPNGVPNSVVRDLLRQTAMKPTIFQMHLHKDEIPKTGPLREIQYKVEVPVQ